METRVEPLRQKLAAARRWWRATRVLSGLAWAVSLVVLLALVCYQWDSHWTLTTHGRELWRQILVGAGVGALLVALLHPLLQRLPDMRLAAAVERRYPVLRERLLTTLDLAPALSPTGSMPATVAPHLSAFSPALAEAVADETHRVSSDLDFRRAVSLHPLRIGVLTMLFTLALLALNIALAGPAFANWLRRMASPNADIAPYAHTRVQVIPDALLLPVGESDWITVKTWGDSVDRCILQVHQQGDRPDTWSRFDLNDPVRVPDQPGEAEDRNVRRFRYHLKHLTGSITLMATANDGHSNEREVEVAPRPTLLSVHLTLHFPAYMHRAEKSLDAPNGSFAAPYGTEVNVTGTANNPLHSVTYFRDNVQAGAWKVEGRQTFGHLSVYKDGVYSLKLVDTHRFDNPEMPRYTVHAERDQAPTVQIRRPAADLDLVPDGSLPLIAHASDDYGVVSMRLAFSKTHEDDSKVGVARIVKAGGGAFSLPGPDGSPEAIVQQRWHIASVSPRPGDMVQYEVDATDNDTLDGPHIGRSQTYHVHIVSLTEMQQRLKEQLDEEQRDLQQLRQHQSQAQQQLEQARTRQSKDRMAQAQDTQRSVAQEAQSLTERVQQLSNQLENNGLATQSELQRRETARQTLQNDSQQKMPSAADSVQKAQNTARDARSQSLNQADRQETDIRHDLDKAQQLLSRTPSADQLAQEAARLAQQQQQLAEGSNSLAEDLRAQHQPDPATRAGLQTERSQQAQTNADTQRLQQQLNEAAKAAQERGDKRTAQAMQRAAEALKQGNVQSNQQQAQHSLDRNSPQNAAPAQSRAAQALQKAAQAAQQATNQQQNDASQSPADRLDQAAKNLQQMAKRQREIAAQVGQHPDASQSRQLGQQEQAMQQQANQAQQQLNGAQSAQQSLQNAQQNLSQSGQQLGQNQPQSAQSPAQKAAQDLQNAARQASRAAQQLRQQQAAQELAGKVERLAQLQHGLHDATQRLDKARQDGNLTGNDMIERRQVAERQAQAENETRELSPQFPSPAFQQAMRLAGRQMHPASKNLDQDEPDTGHETQQAQTHAAQTLDTIARALKQQAQGGSQNQQQDAGQQNSSGAAQQNEAAEALGELMLAQGLQQQLRQDTGALDKARNQNSDHALNSQQQRQNQQLTQGQRDTQEITRRAGEHLQDMPDVAQSVEEATQHMGQAGDRLEQQQTDRVTQGHQDEAIRRLDQAVQQAQQAMQQQQQQQQAQQAAQQGAPMPTQQKGSEPNHKAFTRLVGAQHGGMSAPDQRLGHFGGLTPRTQRALREGQADKVPTEFQDLVNRYYKSLAEKSR